jgi:hypothetical protein
VSCLSLASVVRVELPSSDASFAGGPGFICHFAGGVLEVFDPSSPDLR